VRANKVLHRTLLLQKILSQAEMKFHEELISLKKQTNNHEQEVEEVYFIIIIIIFYISILIS
jgi:hypothetical protein